MSYLQRAFGWPWCRHKWQVFASGAITEGGRKVGTHYELQCQKCGDLKIRNLTS